MEERLCGLLANSLLENGEGGCLPALIIGCLFQSRLEIFDGPRESDPRMVGFFGNKIDLLLYEGEGVICHVGTGQIHLPLIPSALTPSALTPSAPNPV